jgi:hypothetical protein
MSPLTLFRSLRSMFSDNHCILVVTIDRFPNFISMDKIGWRDYVVSPVIKHIPYVKDLDVPYIEFERYIKSIYKNEQVLLIPIKYRWVLRLLRHGTDYNQNYFRVHYLYNGLYHTHVRTYREGL